jgi:hypothetical protein
MSKKTLVETIVEQVKAIFNSDEKKTDMATAKLEDGQEVTAEAFEVGKELMIVTPEGDYVLAPAGEYKLEDGTVITVDEAGLMTAITPGEAPAEAKDETKKEDMSQYVTKSDLKEMTNGILQVLTEMSKQIKKDEPKKVDPSLTDEQKAKIEAARMEFSKRKQAGAATKKVDQKESPKLESKFEYKAGSPTLGRVKNNFANFDWNGN